MSFFDFLLDANNYEERKIANYETTELIVDTCATSDSEQPFETGVCHLLYNSGKWIIVELYDTKEEAQKGHDKWVKKMTANCLPKTLKDVSSCGVVKFAISQGINLNKSYKKGEKNAN